MMERIIEQQQPLCATIHKTDIMPTELQWRYSFLLRPLVDITEAIGGEKWITISTLLHKLLKYHRVPSSDDRPLVKTFKEAILADLQERYSGNTIDFFLPKLYYSRSTI